MNSFFNQRFGFSSLVVALIGLALLLWPANSLILLCQIVGWALLLIGGYFLIRHLSLKDYGIPISMVGDVTAIIGGLLLIFRPITTVSLVPVLIGLAVLCSGALNVYQAFRLRRYNPTRFVLSLIFGLLTIGFAITLILYPFSSVSVMVRAIGILLIFNGLTNAWTAWKLSQY